MAIVINGSGTVTGLAVGGLPDGTVDAGTLATDSVTAAKLEVSAITGADLPAGSVLQVVNVTFSTRVTSTTSTLADTGLTATITPNSTSSTILCLVTLNGTYATASNTNIRTTLLRGATTISNVDDLAGYTNSTAPSSPGTIGINYVDSPASTAATTYKVQFASSANQSDVSINNYYAGGGNSVSTITLMEIAG